MFNDLICAVAISTWPVTILFSRPVTLNNLINGFKMLSFRAYENTKFHLGAIRHYLKLLEILVTEAIRV